MDRLHNTDPFLVTADWLRSVLMVWGRDDCMLCDEPFHVGERVRWLPAAYPGARTDYRLAHAVCVVQELWPPGRR